MLLESMTMADFKKNIRNTKTIIIPFGTVEEHGEHLPLNTDTLIVYEVLKRVVKKRKAFLAPPVYYGVCTTTGGHPGTLSITPATLRSITRDLIKDAYDKGFRKILLITGHGGGLHSAAMKEAAEELIGSLKGARLAVLCPYDLLYKELTELADTPHDSHAGEIETSIVLALAPELVRGRSKEDYPKIPKPFIVRDKMKYWKSGVWGNPEKASAEKGRKAIKLIVDSIIQVMDMA
jgi:creatinine amidohydrolase